MSITPRPGGLLVEIRPLARTTSARFWLVGAALGVLGAAFFGGSRLAEVWETGLKRGDFSDFPLPLLLGLSLAVGISTPAALVGLAALAFAEEKVEVDAETVRVSSTAFERTRTLTIPRRELVCWRETYLPLPPWWTWAVRRLAAQSRGRFHAICGAAGPKEKRSIAVALARATQRPLIGVFGSSIPLPPLEAEF